MGHNLDEIKTKKYEYLGNNLNDQVKMIEKIESLRKSNPTMVDRLPRFIAYGLTQN